MQKERDEARKVASGLAIQEERVNEAQKELSSIHQWIERNHPDGFIDSLTYFQNLERVTENWYDRLDRLEVDAKRFERERDEAREQNAKLRDIAERLFAAGVGRMKTDDWRTLRAELDKIKEGAK
jgi:DNA repair exonuclease SbcCD ATPase subunit